MTDNTTNMEITTEAASSSSNVEDELINNTRYGDFLKNLMQQVMRPELNALKETVTGLCNEVHDLKQRASRRHRRTQNWQLETHRWDARTKS